MRKLTPTDWQTLDRIFTADGWTHKRTKGTHRSYTKPGYIRAIVIPMYKDIGLDIIKANLRTAGISTERYFEIMDRVC